MSIGTGLVDIETQMVDSYLLGVIALGPKIYEAGIVGEDLGITLGDIAELGDVMLPGENFWWSSYIKEVPDRLQPHILEQYPRFAEVSLKGIVKANFKVHFTQRVLDICNGNKELKVTPIKG